MSGNVPHKVTNNATINLNIPGINIDNQKSLFWNLFVASFAITLGYLFCSELYYYTPKIIKWTINWMTG